MTRTIRFKLILVNLSITIITLILLVSISYATFHHYLQQRVLETEYNNLSISAENIDQRIDLLFKMLDWFELNPDLRSFLHVQVVDESSEKIISIGSFKIIRNAIYSNGLSDYIRKAIVANETGNSVQFGTVDGHPTDYSVALEQLQNSDNSIVIDPFLNGQNDYVLCFTRRIIGNSTDHTIGSIFIIVDVSILSKYLKLQERNSNTELFFSIDNKVYRIANGRIEPQPELTREEFILVSETAPTKNGTEEYRYPVYRLENSNNQFIIQEFENLNWFLIQSVPAIEREWERNIFSQILVLIVTTVLFTVMCITWVVDRTINRPILILNRRIEKITAGDFTPDPAIEFSHEIGNIGVGINTMVAEIDRLIHQRVSDEKTKKDLEYRLLQSQINPHFLYNTLNSIQWMATIQKATGIAEMVRSLAVLLKHLSKGTEELIPLTEELSLVKEYCNIQNLRSGGLIELHVSLDDPALEICKVPKFILQPVVENSIFHGIEARGSRGNIDIRIFQTCADTIQVDIIDDGVGIPQHRIETILNHQHQDNDSFNHIGLANIDDRLKLRFGKNFGLRITSELDKYTCVSLTLPHIIHKKRVLNE